jgi:hypothetical protein
MAASYSLIDPKLLLCMTKNIMHIIIAANIAKTTLPPSV